MDYTCSVAEEAKRHLKLLEGPRTSLGMTVKQEKSHLKCACDTVNIVSSDMCEDISKATDVALDLEGLRNLKDAPKCNLNLIACLPPKYKRIELIIKCFLLFSFILILVILYIMLTTYAI